MEFVSLVKKESAKTETKVIAITGKNGVFTSGLDGN